MRTQTSKFLIVTCSIAFSTYLAKGNLDWLPEWIPLFVMLVAGLFFLLIDPEVRKLAEYLFKTKPIKIINPSTRQGVWRTRLRKKAIVLVSIVLFAAIGIGGAAWRYRVNAFQPTGKLEALLLGGYTDTRTSPEYLLVTASYSIDNRAKYPTGLTDWKLILKFPDGRMANGLVPLLPSEDLSIALRRYNYRKITLKLADYLPTKTQQPIPPGGSTTGWFSVVFKHLTEQDIHGNGVVLIANFTEIATGDQHSIEWPIDKPGREVPGLHQTSQ